MKTRLLAMILATAAGCGSNKPAATPPPASTPTPDVASSTPATPAPAATNRPKAEIGNWGFDLGGMDTSVAPGASFYRYANGKWLTSTPIPADKAEYGMFTVLADRSDERTKQIIESASGPAGSDGQRIADYFKAYMDEAAIEAKGTAPIQPELDRIAKIKDTTGVVLEFAASARRLGGRGAASATPFRTVVGQDAREPDKYIGHVSQGGLGLPDRDMYDAKKEQFAKVRDGYQKYIATIFTLIGAKDADKRAAAVYGLEEKLAATHWTRVQNRDANKTYNKMTIDELAKLAPGMAWKPWLHAVGLDGQTQVIVAQPSAITGEAALVKTTPLAVWKDYLTFHAVNEAAPFLPKKFVDANFEMYGKTLTGTPQIKERWKRAVDLITGGMGEAVGQIYVAKYFTPETKAHADALVKNVLGAMGQRLDGLAWMGADTKAKAKAKLATYNPKIGYPRAWRDYSALTIKPDDAVGNARHTAEFEYNRRLAKLGKPVDRDEWGMTPMTVNAYYNPELNEIVFPAAILQPPFFDPNADDAVNYGGIGAVIGHEISHGFDDQGSKFDATGKLENWWTKDDADKFKTGTAKLVAQYNAYCPVPAADGKPAQCVKGELTLGENIGDLAGLTIAYNAYKLSLGGKTPPVLDGFTGDQRFFLGWAQVWRRLYRDQEMANRLVTDPHSPSEFRASVVRNLDAWYDAFKPQPGDALFLPPDQRVRIW
ncbi:MAG TPA: M13-type metalloendopeptidase [Kofleriaceae bacterium]|jgi:putative endopeptidase|nr:M13-type metalloendopeptidase [Kofleriaceae bacterium]